MKILKKKEKRKNMKGITLIALVITIIVLLILTGITIATLTGDNGILTQVTKAKEETQMASEDELRKLTQIEAAAHLEEYEYEDVSGEKVSIPAQCAVSQVEGENTLEDGLVIIDANGNEWVWIEVQKTIEVYPTAGLNVSNFTDEEYLKIYEDLENYTSVYRDSDNKGALTGEDEWYEGCGLESNEYDKLKKKMLKSIYKEGGFYIGRYEVGIGEENIVRNYKNYRGTTTEYPINETLAIQKNKVVYNWITISQAQELSQRLSSALNLEDRTISLMFGIQRDLVLKYIEEQEQYTKDGTNTLIDQELIKSDSVKWGNYSNATFDITNTNAKYSENDGLNYTILSGSYSKPISHILLTTGATERNSVMNIYDLAGNVSEWTLEKIIRSTYPSNSRGRQFWR